MSIYNDVSTQMKDAMKARDKDRLGALRNIRAGFIEALKLDNADTLSDDACLDVLKRLAKQRKDSIDAYGKGGRQDLVDAETLELHVIEEFLPKGPDESVVRGWVQAAIDQTGASGPGDLGRVMGTVMKDHRGEADGAMVRALVSELLGS